MTNQRFRNGRRFLGASVLMLVWIACTAEPRDYGEAGLTVLEPADGTTVSPGQILNFKVEVIPEALPGFVLIMSDVKTVPVPFAGRLNGPPFEGPVEISRSASGVVEVGVYLISSEEGALAGRTIRLNVVSSEPPQRINADGLMQLPAPSSPPAYDSRLEVLGYFEGDVRRDISGPQFGTTYTSLTPEIVSVASDGQLTALKPGHGFVAVENAGLRQYSRVVVQEADGKNPPAEDRTGSVAIQASGFRRDPQTGFFTQQLTLRNTSSVPLTKAIHLIIDDLPEGIELKGSMGRPKPPLTGQIVHVDVKEKDFLSPGETATATLKFSNREGVPITYSRKVYCGKRP